MTVTLAIHCHNTCIFSSNVVIKFHFRLLSNSKTILHTSYSFMNMYTEVVRLVVRENLSHMHKNTFCFSCVVTTRASFKQRKVICSLIASQTLYFVQLGCWNPHATHVKRNRKSCTCVNGFQIFMDNQPENICTFTRVHTSMCCGVCMSYDKLDNSSYIATICRPSDTIFRCYGCKCCSDYHCGICD